MAGKKQRASKTSSGIRRKSRANQMRRKLESKKRRWERYTAEINAGKRNGTVSRWNTDGIDRALSNLAKIIKAG